MYGLHSDTLLNSIHSQNEMKILILYGVIGSMATVDSALFSSSAIRVIKMVVLPLLYISLNGDLAKLEIKQNTVPFSLIFKANP